MRRLLALTILFAFPATAFAQGGPAGNAAPMVIEFAKIPVGSWAEYNMSMGGMGMKTRWALVGRQGKNHVVEMSMEGGPAAQMGGKMTVQMVLAPDPTAPGDPVKELVMQMGNQDPVQMPTGMQGMPTQSFKKPDPKKLVGKEEIRVAGGTFKTSHYRDKIDQATVDAWVSEEVPPLGLIKVQTTPVAGGKTPTGQPIPPMVIELAAHGKDAKPSITKKAKPFDPAMFGDAAPLPIKPSKKKAK